MRRCNPPTRTPTSTGAATWKPPCAAPSNDCTVPTPVIATYINAAAVIVGALIGLLLRRAISDRFRDVVTSGIGVITAGARLPARLRVAADRLPGPVGGNRRPARRVVEDRAGRDRARRRAAPVAVAARNGGGDRGRQPARVRGRLSELLGAVLRRRHDAGRLVPRRRRG